MRPSDQPLAQEILVGLNAYETAHGALVGISEQQCRDAFVEQLVESVRRVRYVLTLNQRPICGARANPHDPLFDPLRAAILHRNAGDIEEAFWLTFLSVHFGKHRRTGWRLTRDVYGQLGTTPYWTWVRLFPNPLHFKDWLAANEEKLSGADGVSRHFGNHRKYETLKSNSDRSTGKVVETYVTWIASFGSHQQLVNCALATAHGDPGKAFAHLFDSMKFVLSFGRTARFDYLSMLGKLQLAAIEAPLPYLAGATGPLVGARLLFTGSKGTAASATKLESDILALHGYLPMISPHQMQIFEDALCNWQKSPDAFRPFRG